MIRAYIPWYLVRNYVAFALVACLGVLQLAAARRSTAAQRRVRYTVAWGMLLAAYGCFYALAPELLTPGPAGGELTVLFGLVALAAILITRLMRGFPASVCPAGPGLVSCSEAGSCPAWTTRVAIFLAVASAGVFLVDQPLFHLLNSLAQRTSLIDIPVQFLMNDYIVPTALVLALLGLWWAGNGAAERTVFQRTVLRALIALALASITLKLINEIYFQPRPFAFDTTVRLLFYHPSDSTMPSNAATVAGALSVAVWLRQRRWGGAMLALSGALCLARVVGGVHYPSDIVAGLWLGGLWAWAVNRAGWLDRGLDAAAGLARRVGLA